ncbi:hypothetical protein [Deinococcus soli (ex Cha et al. 2016)]|uniref:hypothetical protein n=1 Tax=Deinococcus soli (ex Cha et al. 2016) TaxID=1309411 RepID=UPI00166E47FC|nr:hypothetical protein [Deinococcus soli (ex Cha et al. 2016)]GGB71203.1 hypothetical protein GCM10008019_29220 [Deinococcus soli (ex Cha et al. 2016)]
MPLILPRRHRSRAALDVAFHVRAPAAARLSVAFGVQAVPPTRLDVAFDVAATVPSPSSSPLLDHEIQVDGLPGPVLSTTLTHDGPYEELEVTVDGLHPLALPTVSLQLTSRVAQGVTLGVVPTRVFRAQSQEPQVNRRERTTTFRYRSSLDDRLRGLRLPETIPWKLNPSEDPCLTVRRTVGISAHVRALFRQHVDPAFVLEFDPLTRSRWVEGRLDFTTLNITPQALWDATYGALGMVLQVRRKGTGVRLVGTWATPVQVRSGPAVSLDWQEEREQAREWYQTPRRFTVKGAPRATPLTREKLLAWIGPDPDREALEREILLNYEWYEPPSPSGTSVAQSGFLKLNGQLVRQVEVTTGDVVITEIVDGKKKTDTLYGMGTGVKLTETRFDPTCPSRPLFQQVRTLAWGYDGQTKISSYSVPGPGLNTTLKVGDLVGNERTTTTYQYSPQGHLTAQTTSTTRVASLQQQNADAEINQRGPLQGREETTQTVTQRWAPTSGSLWRYDPGTSGQTLLPVYDDETQEAVRTVAVARATPDAPRLTDQAPPSYDCRPVCDVLREVLDPTGVVLHAGDAGLREDEEVSVDFLDVTDLVSAARMMLTSRWHRLVTTFTVPFASPFQQGDWTADGLVQRVRITAQDGQISSEVTCTQIDTTLLQPGSAAMENYLLDPQQGRAVMLTRLPGGARARLVTGWNPSTGEALAEDAFIGFRTGFPPSPGDELEWQLERGQREATNGRR